MHLNTNSRLFTLCSRLIYTNANLSQKWIEPVGVQTNISIYNPIIKKKVPLILKNKNFLTWYMCGPTVYDSAHIGHASTYIRCDIIRRVLTHFFNIDVLAVMGITDIDDKIIQRSNVRKQNFKELARFYEQEFIDDMEMLNIIKPQLQCRVTDFIPSIISFIQKILDKEIAYITEDGSVYFDSTKYQIMNNYGKLSNLPKETKNFSKKSSWDFALWKSSKEGEPYWNSPWSNGRPGWHIECSTIASSILGNSIDIHSGGIDLAFPHHENEEAQSCCHHGVSQWVNYWLHTGHLHLKNDAKMSKSLGNVINIQDFLQKHTSNEFRFLCLLSHYRKNIEFSNEQLHTARALLEKIDNFLSECNDYIAGRNSYLITDENLLFKKLEDTQKEVEESLSDDFNTGQAVKSIIHLIDTTNKMFQNNQESTMEKSKLAIVAISSYITTVLENLGIVNTMNSREMFNVEQIINNLLQFRSTVRNRAIELDKDGVLLSACDNIRKELITHGIQIKDMKENSSWSIKKYKMKTN